MRFQLEFKVLQFQNCNVGHTFNDMCLLPPVSIHLIGRRLIHVIEKIDKSGALDTARPNDVSHPIFIAVVSAKFVNIGADSTVIWAPCQDEFP